MMKDFEKGMSIKEVVEKHDVAYSVGAQYKHDFIFATQLWKNEVFRLFMPNKYTKPPMKIRRVLYNCNIIDLTDLVEKYKNGYILDCMCKTNSVGIKTYKNISDVVNKYLSDSETVR